MKKDFSILIAVLFLSAGCTASNTPKQNKITPASAQPQSTYIFSGDRTTIFKGEPSDTKTITLDNDNQSLQMKIGETFTLSLGTYYRWKVIIDDPGIVGPAASAQVSGTQGTYQAKTSGITKLTATGDPPCYPQCLLPSRLFKLSLQVAGRQ